jgi:hypothetical protein
MPVNEMHGYGLFERTPEQRDIEILYSYSPPPLRKGGFLKPGEGVLVTGTVLAYDSESGLWLKYDDTAGANEVHTITPSGTVSGGSWDLTILPGTQYEETFTDIAFDDTAAEVQTAVDERYLDDHGLPAGTIDVGGAALSSGAMTLTYDADLGGQNWPQATVDVTGLTGAGATAAVTTTTAGVAGGAVAAGILAAGADAGTAVDGTAEPINVYLRGAFKKDLLVGLDANAITDLAGRTPVTAYNCFIIP